MFHFYMSCIVFSKEKINNQFAITSVFLYMFHYLASTEIAYYFTSFMFIHNSLIIQIKMLKPE